MCHYATARINGTKDVSVGALIIHAGGNSRLVGDLHASFAARINGDKQLRHINAIATFHTHAVKINFDKWLDKWISRSYFRITGVLSDNCMIIYLRCLHILKKNIR